LEPDGAHQPNTASFTVACVLSGSGVIGAVADHNVTDFIVIGFQPSGNAYKRSEVSFGFGYCQAEMRGG
jgi:hypothetical protein